MTTLFVVYPGENSTRFDRDYYVDRHLPLVLDAWRPYGLTSVAALFPPREGAGTIAVCVCTFHDEASIQTAFGSPESEAVMTDLQHFTDAKPVQLQGVPI